EEWVEIDDFSEDFDSVALRSDAFVESDDRVELDPETLQGSADERVDAYAETPVAEPRGSVAGPEATDDTQAPLERLEPHEALAGPEQAGRAEHEDLAELD